MNVLLFDENMSSWVIKDDSDVGSIESEGRKDKGKAALYSSITKHAQMRVFYLIRLSMYYIFGL